MKNLPEPDRSLRRPKRWERVVLAAYLRSLGATQAAAAKAVGRAPRTIRVWEADPVWPEALAEARLRWFGEAEGLARAAVLTALKGDDVATARWLLDRVDPDLRPTQNIQHEAVARIAVITGIERPPGDG